MSKVLFLLLFVFCLFILAMYLPQTSKWKGTKQEVDGVTTVKNPKKPMYSEEIVFFEEELSIGVPEGPEEYILNHILSFAADDDGNIYILDLKPFRVKVYDREGKYLRTIGREGQGPGEFQVPGNIQFTEQKELMVSDTGRGAVLFFSAEGQFLREIKSQVLILGGYMLFDSRQNIYVNKFPLREPVSQLLRLSPPYENPDVTASLPDPAKRVVPPSRIRFALLPDGHLIWGVSSEYKFHIIESQGRTVRRIEKEHTALRVSDDYKEQYYERLPPSISKASQAFSSHFPAFDLFFTDDVGRLYVKSYEKLKGTDKYVIDIFDPEGRFLCQTALRVGDEISLDQDKYLIKDNKLYSGETNTEGFHCLKRYGIIWKN
jgi:hypothetical protein